MRRFSIFIIFILAGFTAKSSHILGGEIGYKHISGLTYQIEVKLYGDCQGNSFPSLFDTTTIARVGIYNGNTIIRAVDCEQYGDYGKEITPVCPKDSLNTSCRNGTLPGISEFKFRYTLTLPSSSANWRFVFNGRLDAANNSYAGRSGQITNINQSTNTTVIYLEATLNNMNSSNSTPTLTTIPTPFFCINQSQSYNPGASDVDGDLLDFKLIDGLWNSSTNTVTYLNPYSGAQPLATSSFSFNPQNGQLSFTPNAIQVALVVNRIDEYRNGVKVGSMMREMNFIVLNNCNNQSPGGGITSYSAGEFDPQDQTIRKICYPDSILNMVIQGGDPDSNNINLSVSGLSAAFYNIVNNNTPNPQLSISYPITFPTQGTQSTSFFVTYQDDACPLSSNQQIAYTIEVENPITIGHTVIDESCKPGGDGIINLNASSTNTGSVVYSINGGSFLAQNTYTALSAGDYNFQVRDSAGCIAKQSLRVDTAVNINLASVRAFDITCGDRVDGKVEANSLPSSLPAAFSLLPTSLTNTTGRFDNLLAGNYTLIVDGPRGCSDTASVRINDALDISFENIRIEDNRCDLQTGRIEIGSNIIIPAEYSISPNQQTNRTGNFGSLIAGQYIITVIDSNGCYKDTLLEVKDDPNQMNIRLSKQDVSCEGEGNDGSATVIVDGAVQPVTYLWESVYGAEGAGDEILNQRSGVKRVYVTDAIGCALNDYIFVDPANCCEKVFIPNAFSPNGDGRNETFNLRTPLTMNEVKFVVANRWGQVVWQANNHLDTWDGNYPDGTPADIGTYYYFLRYQCDSDKQTYKLKGDITIIR